MSVPFLSIIIPAYNEQFYIEKTLNSIINYFKTTNFTTEIIVVNDGSKDKTREIVLNFISKFEISKKKLSSENININLIENYKNYGKGFSVKNGVLSSKGQFILFTDADLSTPIEEFENLFSNLKDRFDIAIASRDLPDSIIIQHQNIIRESMGKLFNFFVRKIVGLNFRDTQCGYKLFKSSAAFLIFPEMQINGFGFDVEILFIAERFGLKIIEIPVKWHDNKDSRVNIFKDPLKMFLCLFKIKKLHKNI